MDDNAVTRSPDFTRKTTCRSTVCVKPSCRATRIVTGVGSSFVQRVERACLEPRLTAAEKTRADDSPAKDHGKCSADDALN